MYKGIVPPENSMVKISNLFTAPLNLQFGRESGYAISALNTFIKTAAPNETSRVKTAAHAIVPNSANKTLYASVEKERGIIENPYRVTSASEEKEIEIINRNGTIHVRVAVIKKRCSNTLGIYLSGFLCFITGILLLS